MRWYRRLMPRTLRTGALIVLAIAIPVVVASATYAIGVRSLAPTTRLQVNVANPTAGDSPSPGTDRRTTTGVDPGSWPELRRSRRPRRDAPGARAVARRPGGGSSSEDHHGGLGLRSAEAAARWLGQGLRVGRSRTGGGGGDD